MYFITGILLLGLEVMRTTDPISAHRLNKLIETCTSWEVGGCSPCVSSLIRTLNFHFVFIFCTIHIEIKIDICFVILFFSKIEVAT